MEELLRNPPRIWIVTGHYGCGKTNFSMNLAMASRQSGQNVALVDLDIVNPYFRSADFTRMAYRHQIEVLAPPLANSNLDLPTMPADILSVFHRKDRQIVLDVGGDDSGATALGQFSGLIQGDDYRMLYVINCYRYFTRGADDTVQLMRQIERASRLRVTGLVNNSHLSHLTTAEDVRASISYAEEIAAVTGLPIVAHAVRKELAGEFEGLANLFPISIYVRTPWDSPLE